jgi:DNA-binding NtrC family response regulator
MRPLVSISFPPAELATDSQPHELLNAAQKAMAGNVSRSITIELNPDHADLKKLREEVQRMVVERTLRESRGNVAKAARCLGITRPTLYSFMSRYGLRRV